MRPVCYTQEGNLVKFHYRFSDLRKFITIGKSYRGRWGALIKLQRGYYDVPAFRHDRSSE